MDPDFRPDLDINPLTHGCSLEDLSPEEYLIERLRLLDKHFYRHHKHDRSTRDLEGLSDKELIEHFIKRGPLEKRVYNRQLLEFLDWDYYIKIHPDLDLKGESDAIHHWLYHGVFQGKAPNNITSRLLEADIHLFQMGKVGSKSLQYSIGLTEPRATIPHLHFAQEMLISYPGCYYSYPEIIRFSKKRIRFLAGVREPVSRVVSGWLEASISPYSSMSTSHLMQLLECNTKSSQAILKDSCHILEWFKHQFYSDIDVYSQPFDKEKGYSIINGPRHSVLVYRIDKLSGLWGIISNYIGIGLHPASINKSHDKGEPEARVLERFARFKLTQDVLHKILESRYINHFFDADDKDIFLRRYA